MDTEWMSARDALLRFEAAMPKSPRLAAGNLANAAAAGLVAARATRLITKDAGSDNCEPPYEFWQAVARHPLGHAWDVGSFDIWFEGEQEWQAFGVQFDRAGVEKMAGNPTELVSPNPAAPEGQHKKRRGRPRITAWDNWVAELVYFIHEEGYPPGEGSEGQEALIVSLASRLAARGLEEPGRTTVQASVQAVLDRYRNAGK